MSTQLRLIAKTDTTRGTARRSATATADDTPARPLRGRVASSRRPSSRRSVHWQGQWRLDERTRAVGKAGVATARAALAAAHPEPHADGAETPRGLRRAS